MHGAATNAIMGTCRAIGGYTDWDFLEVCGVGLFSVFIGVCAALMVAFTIVMLKIGKAKIK